MTDKFFLSPFINSAKKPITEQNATTGAVGTLSLSRPLFRNTYFMEPICAASKIGYMLSIRVKKIMILAINKWM